MGKPKTFTHVSGETLTLKPFKGKDLDVLLSVGDNPSSDDIKNLVYHALQGTELSCTKDEVDDLDMQFITWVSECVGEINGSRKPKD